MAKQQSQNSKGKRGESLAENYDKVPQMMKDIRRAIRATQKSHGKGFKQATSFLVSTEQLSLIREMSGPSVLRATFGGEEMPMSSPQDLLKKLGKLSSTHSSKKGGKRINSPKMN